MKWYGAVSVSTAATFTMIPMEGGREGWEVSARAIYLKKPKSTI